MNHIITFVICAYICFLEQMVTVSSSVDSSSSLERMVTVSSAADSLSSIDFLKVWTLNPFNGRSCLLASFVNSSSKRTLISPRNILNWQSLSSNLTSSAPFSPPRSLNAALSRRKSSTGNVTELFDTTNKLQQ